MAPENLAHPAIHDQMVTQSARFTLGGQAIPQVTVRYYIGAQGPFTDNFDADKYNDEAVKQAQLAHVHTLQQIGVPLPGPPVERMTPEPGIVVTAGGAQPVPPKFRLGAGA